jgi:TM2 domain-containing membrane protein YozV
MAFCSNCGKEIAEGVKFCSSCGKAVDSVPDGPVVSASPYQPVSTPVVREPVVPAITVDERYCFSCGSVIKKAAVICPKCGVNQSGRNNTAVVDVYCVSCGKIIKKEAVTCPFCGVPQTESTGYPPGYVSKSWTTALLLCIFLGAVGGHRFYTGKIGTAILMILVTGVTIGIGGLIWWIIDLVSICTHKFTDKQGYALKKD